MMSFFGEFCFQRAWKPGLKVCETLSEWKAPLPSRIAFLIQTAADLKPLADYHLVCLHMRNQNVGK